MFLCETFNNSMLTYRKTSRIYFLNIFSVHRRLIIISQPLYTDTFHYLEIKNPKIIRHGHHGNSRSSLVDKASLEFCIYIIQGTYMLTMMLHPQKLALKNRSQP